MGDPRKPNKKFTKPGHPWQAERIEDEKSLLKEYGLLRKKEIWKFNTLLENYKGQAKKATASRTKQGDLEGQLLLAKLRKYGLITDTQGLDDVLGMGVKDILERRLQTQLVRKQRALSMKQARQFILHGHVMIDGRKITSPSYLVSVAEESKFAFMPKSPLADESHPEREKKAKTPEQIEKEALEKEMAKKKSGRSRSPRNSRGSRQNKPRSVPKSSNKKDSADKPKKE